MMSKSLNYAYPQKFAEGGEVPSGVEAPEGFEFAGMVDSKYKGPVASFTKVGDDTGFTVYAAENEYGTNKGKTGYYYDDIGEEVGSAGTGGYLDANDAFNQGRSRSNNYVSTYNTLIDRGVKLDDAAMEQLNAALAHHDKYLGNATGYASTRDNLIDTMNAVQGYENYTGQTYTIGDEGARLLPDVGDTFTTMAMGEEDAPFAEPTIEEIRDRLDLFPDSATTMAVGEEDGGGLMPPPDKATTLAVGEEDGVGGIPKDALDVVATMAMGEEAGTGYVDGGWTAPPPGTATTMAVGEEDGGMPPPPGVDPMVPVPDTPGVDFTLPVRDFSLPPGVDPMFPAPVVNPVFTPSPVVNPVFTPSPDNTAFTPPPPPPGQGRTYGAYSGTPMGPTNSIQPFTPYMAPQPAESPDLQSLITDTDYFLNNSAPRTSVFKRS